MVNTLRAEIEKPGLFRLFRYRSETEMVIPPISCLRSSNRKALKVAGLTLLAAMLIAGQAFTAYSVYQQSEKLSMLERRSDRLQEMTVRARGEEDHAFLAFT